MADNALLKGLGGIMVGVGEGLQQQGKEKRALALEALRQNRLDQRAGADRDFRASEAQKSRDASASMVKDTFTGADGKSYMLTAGGKVEGLGVSMGEDNKNEPANVREAKWLVKNGVAPDLNKAYEMVRTRKTVDPTSMRQKALSWVAAQKDRYGRPKYSEPEAQAAAVSAYEKWATGDSEGAVMALKSLEPKDEKKDETAWYESLWSSIGFGGDGKDSTSVSMPMPESPKEAQGGDMPPAPRAKDAREVGKVYLAPDGRKIKWMGNGWQLVQ